MEAAKARIFRLPSWPGLKWSDLQDRCDLKPTADLRVVLRGVLKDHLRVADEALANKIFPGSGAVGPASGLVG